MTEEEIEAHWQYTWGIVQHLGLDDSLTCLIEHLYKSALAHGAKHEKGEEQ